MKKDFRKLLVRHSCLVAEADLVEARLLGDTLSARQRKSLNRKLEDLIGRIEEVRVELINSFLK